MKSLLLSVRCVYSFASDTPETFCVTLDDDQIGRIQMLANEVQRLGICSLEESFYDGLWSGLLIDDVADLSKPDDELKSTSCRVEVPMLQVSSGSFCFTAVPKHCDDDLLLITSQIPISVIDTPEPYIAE